ncbi:hypothetical protein V493_06345 [Pseudogymnoascus sp. VKM F-4281 (FW-2241)]|nr:hypothetical protein V493_06345 [Pseudogymnoascus sp. VKM F-4281 (FW-2241)]
MVKILKTIQPKHKETLSPYIQSFVQNASTAPWHSLPQALADFPTRWPFPRGDLYHWIPLLNRFDSDLETFCTTYELNKGPQVKDFGCELLQKGGATAEQISEAGLGPEGDREVIERILHFSRILLENCGNRSIYSSSTHLSDLLNSTSLSLLAATLQIGTQLAQRYQATFRRIASSHRQTNATLLANHYNIDLDKVQQLSQPFSRTVTATETTAPTVPNTPVTPNAKGKDKAYFGIPVAGSKTTTSTSYANNLVSLVRSGTLPDPSPKGKKAASTSSQTSAEVDWNEWGDVRITYHESQQRGEEAPPSTAHNASAAPVTPTPVRRTSMLGNQHGNRTSRATAPEEAPATPSRSSTMPAAVPAEEKATSSLKVIDVPASKVSEHSVQELLQEYLPNVPDSSKYTLLTKLRVAKALSTSLDTRRQMLAVRLLAVTNLAYIYPEPSFLEKVLKQDSEEPRRLQLIYQLAELIHPPAQGDLGIPRSLQTIAVNALEGLAQHQHKYQDVCTALNTNVNHGVLLYIVRKAVAEMATDEPGDKHTENDEWHSALFALLSHVATLPRAGNELVTAGLVPILVEVLTLRTSVAEGSYPRVLNFLDAIVFNVKDAFQVLANADGLDAISNLIVHEVQSSTEVASKGEGMPADYRSPSIDYEIPYYQQQSIKWLFKFIHHMMNQAGGYGGNFDRLLRNLIDSPQLLGSLREIISHAKIFGSSVWTNAVSILNDFINNEPTSFAIIAEAGLSKAVLEAVLGQEITVAAPKDGAPQPETTNEEEGSPARTDDDTIFSVAVDQTPHPPTQQMLEAPRPGPLARGIMPSSEAIIIVPEAFGAICLNNAGMKMFLESNALQSFFEIFESPAHVKVLDNDANNLATSLGATFDELVRHHPALKTAILNAVLDMVARVSHLCKTRTETEKLGAKLLVTNANGDVVVADRSLLSEVSDDGKGKGKSVDTDADVEMTGVSTEAAEPTTVSKPLTPAEDDRENNVTPYIAAVANFLSALFSNAGIRNLFMENGGVEFILDLAELPVLPHSPSDERSHRNMHTVIALLAEQKAHILVPSLIKRAQAAADTLTPFTQHQGPDAYFAKFIDDCKPSNDRSDNLLARGTSLVEAMVTAQNLCMALRQCISSPIYSRSQTSSFSSMNLADYYVRLVKSLGAILAASIKEDFKLMRLAPRHWRRAGRQSVQMFMSDAPEPLIPTIDSTEEALHSLLPEAQGTAPMATLVTDSSGAEKPIHKAHQTKTLTTEEKNSPEFKNFQNLHYLLGKMPISISIFFQVIGKGLVPKRTPDTFQRQSNVSIANAIVETVLSQLTSVSDESSSETYTFWVLMFRTVKDILVNNARTAERPQECITIVVQAFMKAGGFDTINHMLELFDAEVRNNADKTVNFNDVDLLLRNDLATLGIKHILELYGPLVTGKNVGDSFQSSTMHSRSDRERNSPNYFSAGQFVLEVRMAILPAVQKLWESDIVEKGSKIIPNKLIDIIRNVMETDLEEGAFRNGDKAIVPSKQGKKKWRVNRENLVKLQAAEYEEDLAIEALFRCNNSYTSALEYCKAQRSERSGGRNRFGHDDYDPNNGTNDASGQEPRTSTGSVTPDQGAAQGDNGAHEAPNDGVPAPVLTQSPEEFAPHANVPPNLQQMLLDNMNRTLENSEAGNLFAAISGGGEQTNLPERVTNQQPSPSSADKTLESQPEIPTVERLNAERLKIRSNLIERCLEVINAHGEFTFEIADLITTVIDKSPDQAEMRATMGGTLVVALTSFLSDDVREVGKKIASYAHLLALMLQDPQFYKASLEELKSNLGNLLEFVKLSPDHKSEESSPWVAHILLIVEILLSDDAEPRETEWTIPTSETSTIDQPVLKAPELVVSTEDRATLFEAILDMLPRIGKDESLALAVMRILVILTRTRHIAVAMGEKKNIQRLFVMAKQLAGAATSRIQSPLMLILRHIVEDDETIKQIMRSQIKFFLEPGSTRSPRHPDITLYLRSMSNLVVRQPELFVEVSNEMVKLVKWTTTTADQPGRQQLELQDKYKRSRRGKPEDAALPTLKPTEELSMEDVKPSTETADTEAGEGSKVAVEHKVPIVENPDGVIYFLLCELLNYRDVEDKEPAPPAPAEDKDKEAATTSDTTTPSTSGAEGSSEPAPAASEATPATPAKPETKKTKPEFKAEEHPIFIYRCFLLQCLTELLASYNRTKVEFINFKRNAPTHAATPSKPRSNVVNYLLFDLIPSGSLDHAETLAMRKKVSTSSWADSTITALLSKTGEQIMDRERDNTDSDDEPDLLFVRKFVLENIIKAYREASTSTEPLEIKYSRMLSLADLMSHIMAGKDNIGDPNVTIRSQQQLKRIMFEKGYIGALTASIADIDLNFPGAKRAVKHILRPLKALTQTAIELSEVGKVALTPGQHDEDEIASASSVSDVDDDREETPDLFRNSTLGMFEPDRDHESSSEGEDDDEEMYDEDGYEEEMEGYEDGPIEDDEDNISDEDEDLEGMGEIEGLDGDHGMDVEVIMDDDEEDDESGSSDDDDEDEDDDMDEDDEDDRVQIIDDEGNPHPLAELDDEEDWESEDEDEEEDYEGMAADEEEEAMHAGGHGPLGRLVHAFGGEPHHHGDIDGLLQRIEDERGGDPDMDIEYLDEDHEEDDDVDEEEEDMDDDEDMYEEYQPEPGMPFTFEWNDEQEPPMIISHRGHRAHAAPQPSPYFFGAHRDPLGGTFDPSISGFQDLRQSLESIQAGLEQIFSHGLIPQLVLGAPNNRTNPQAVRDYHRGSYRSHRPGPTPRDNNDGTNPLLQRGDRARGDAGLPGSTPFMGRDALFNIVGRGPFGGAEAGGPAAILNDLFTQLPFPAGALPSASRNGGALHFHVTGGPGGADAREFQAMFGGMRPGMPRGHERRPGAAEPGAATTFTTQLTATRWSEEARLLFGPRHPDMALRVLMGLMAVIVPGALEAEKKAIQDKKEAEEKKRQEEEEKAAQAAKEAEEKAAKEKKEAEEREAEEKARAEEAAAAAAAAPPVVEEPQEAAGDAQPMEGVETGEAGAAGQEGEGAPAEDRPRVTIPFRDGTLDITELGIDLDYLDALPEELREEVITGAIAQRRSDAAATGAPPSEIDQEFLNALPDEIRAEIIQQERQDRRRRERDEARRQAAANGAPVPVPQEMDAASILATLPADLRAQVLAEQDEDVLAQLPPEYIAQARASMGGGHPLRGLTRVIDGARPGRPSGAGEIVKPVRRSIVQMLDKPGVATLLRLMFIFQQDSLRNTLYQVLQNISENRHNRGEVISTILHILQDGSADMTAVERSFAHLSLRAKQPKEKDPKTPLSLSRKNTGTGLAALTTVPNTDISPLMVVQQCLGALIYLCKVNLHVPSFFLTEHESAVSGLKRNASRKGKGKDIKALKFPLNSLLVLLDRKLIMESSPVMESLSDLLSRITAPLQTFERKQKEAEEAAKKAEEKPAVTEGETESAEQQAETMDTDPAAPAATEAPPAEAGASTTDVANTEGEKTDEKAKEPEKKKVRPFVPPVVPDANLKLVINIFVARECSAKTFRETLSTIKNLSCLPGAKAVFGKELICKAQELGEVILLDLEELFPQIQKASNSTELQGVALTKFSPSGSDQNKLLRVLTALDHLFDPKHARKDPTTEADAGSETADTEKQDLLATLYENSTFGPMWEKLSACLSAIRQRDHMLNVATILLPLIESLMVVCKNTTLKDQPLRGKDNMLTSPVPESRMESLFFTFTEEHRKILNDLVRNTPKLMSGTFSLLVKNPKVLEFDNKRNYFNRSIHNRNNPARQSYPSLQLSVRRDQVFHDSFKSLYFKSGDEMKFGKLSIRFHGEEGVDAGGVTREWFQVLSRQMFDPGYALFIPVSSDRTTFHPNLTSSINPEHLMFFKFIGRVIGKALYEGRVLDCHFSRAVYKRILGKAVSVKDMESLDPEYYKSVVWMLENDITDIISESFSVDNDKFGVVETVDLIENGRNVPVTEENKHEYVRLMVEFKLTGSVQEQLDNFLKGFHEIIPAELVAIFNEQELELLISGLPEIDVDDWKANTEYHNYTAASPQIQWFWRAIRSFDKEERAKMLQFVTGTSKVPLNGFKELEGMNGFSRFNIHRDYGNKDRLPSSHTCFNQLDLPEYESYEMLRQQVLTAITTGSEYFGFA